MNHNFYEVKWTKLRSEESKTGSNWVFLFLHYSTSCEFLNRFCCVVIFFFGAFFFSSSCVDLFRGSLKAPHMQLKIFTMRCMLVNINVWSNELRNLHNRAPLSIFLSLRLLHRQMLLGWWTRIEGSWCHETPKSVDSFLQFYILSHHQQKKSWHSNICNRSRSQPYMKYYY